MPYCENCGAQISDTAKFCTECGTPCRVRPKTEMPPVETPAPEAVPVLTQPPVQPQPEPQPVVIQPQPVAAVQPVTEPSPAQPVAATQPETAPVEQTFFAPPATVAPVAAATVSPQAEPVMPEPQSKPRKGMAALAYLGILVLIPLLFARKNPFARAHTAQGLTLYLMTLVCNVLSELLMGKLTAISPVLTIAVYTVLGAVSVLLFVFSVVGLIWALGGKNKSLPLVGKIRLLK